MFSQINYCYIVTFSLFFSRCSHVTDIGVGYLSTMTSLTRLYLRWCTQLRDFGLQHLYTMKNLKILSLAGKKQFDIVTTRHENIKIDRRRGIKIDKMNRLQTSLYM